MPSTDERTNEERMKTPRVTRDKALTLLLVALVLDMFVIELLTEWTGFAGRVMDVTFTLVIVFAVVAIAGGRALRILGGPLATVAVVTRWLELEGARRLLLIWRDASSFVLLVLVAVVVLQQVLGPGRVTGDRIRGAIVAYLLIGLAFSLAYSLIDVAAPGSFAVAGSPTTLAVGAADGELRWVYYSLAQSDELVDLRQGGSVESQRSTLPGLRRWARAPRAAATAVLKVAWSR